MKLQQIDFVHAVRCLATSQSASAFSAETKPQAGYGYTLEATRDGVFAQHPKVGKVRLVPWSNIKWVDLAAGEEMPKGPGRPKKESE